MGAPPKTFSIESLQSLKLIAYPPNAFRPFAMSSSSFVGRVTVPWPGGITTTGTRGEKVKIPSLGGLQTSGKYPGGVSGGSRGWCPDARLQRAWNAGITSRANQRSCSLNSLGGRPSAQWIMKSSSPGYFASTDLIPSMTCGGGPQNQAFCWMPSVSVGTRAGAPGVPHVRPCSRSEEHTSELQSPCNLVCRLLLEKKKKTC